MNWELTDTRQLIKLVRYVGEQGIEPAPPREPRRPPEGEYTYVIGAAGIPVVKIGTSRDPLRRLTDLRIGSPVHLELVANLAVSEHDAHHALDAHHSHGEWFHHNDEVRAYILEHSEEAEWLA